MSGGAGEGGFRGDAVAADELQSYRGPLGW